MPQTHERKSKVYQIRLTPGEMAFLCATAFNMGIPLSKYIRSKIFKKRSQKVNTTYKPSAKSELYRSKGQYVNHYIMKQNRIIKLQDTQEKCEICGEKGRHIHHKDKTNYNHNLNNLLLVCVKCHRQFHKKIVPLSIS